ncbi:MAG: flagellar basal body-associated FliL family protein [Proteobacteria bacterium]|nr:flagellar basal body-associated FliL family protein [Pseudomonadota bacterium]
MEEEEQIEEENIEQPEEKKKGKFKLILLIVFLALIIGAGGTYFFFGDKIIQQFSGTPEGTVEPKKEKKEKAVGPILSFEPFLFNISGNSSRFAKVSIGIELKDVKVLEEAKKMVPIVRDRVLSVLGTKGPEMLMDVNNRNAIKQELYNALKNMFKDQGDLTAIYITDIIIQ